MGFVWVGAALTAAGLAIGARTWLFLRGAASTEGRVVGMQHRSGSRGPTYSPVVEYRSADGAVHRVTEGWSSNRPGVKAGDVVPVNYDPQRPEKGRLAKPFSLWGLPGFFVFMGLTFLLADLA